MFMKGTVTPGFSGNIFFAGFGLKYLIKRIAAIRISPTHIII
jgi:hypothetical protein